MVVQVLHLVLYLALIRIYELEALAGIQVVTANGKLNLIRTQQLLIIIVTVFMAMVLGLMLLRSITTQ